MAIPKVCGIETEYGILVRGADSNPVSASSLLINAYLASTNRKVTWDFEDERPGNDARGFSVDDLLGRPRPSGDQHTGVPHGAGGRSLRPWRRGDRPGEHGRRIELPGHRRRDP